MHFERSFLHLPDRRGSPLGFRDVLVVSVNPDVVDIVSPNACALVIGIDGRSICICALMSVGACSEISEKG